MFFELLLRASSYWDITDYEVKDGPVIAYHSCQYEEPEWILDQRPFEDGSAATEQVGSYIRVWSSANFIGSHDSD